jgi:hypothetical protein
MDVSVTQPTEPRPAVEFLCAQCSKQVVVCRSCWRNQKYCSEECSNLAYAERHRLKQKKYRMTEKGSSAHKASQKRYRLREKNRD